MQWLQDLNDQIMRNEFIKSINAELAEVKGDDSLKLEIDRTDYARRFERSLQLLEQLTPHQREVLTHFFEVRFPYR